MTIQGMNVNDWNEMIPFRARRKVDAYLDQKVTQETLGKWLGYTRSAVCLWERGQTQPVVAMKAIYLMLLDDPSHILTIRKFTAKGEDDGSHDGS